MSTLKILIGMLIVFLFVLPLQAQAEEDKADHLLIVNVYERRLTLYEFNGGEYRELKRYPIAVPANDWLPLPLIGEVKKIEISPWWYPTKATQIVYLKKKGIDLPNAISPDDQKNAMGKVKITIIFENFNVPIRIHGTNDPSSIGRRVSRGCIRMHNNQILELAEIIKGAKTKVIIY